MSRGSALFLIYGFSSVGFNCQGGWESELCNQRRSLKPRCFSGVTIYYEAGERVGERAMDGRRENELKTKFTYAAVDDRVVYRVCPVGNWESCS